MTLAQCVFDMTRWNFLPKSYDPVNFSFEIFNPSRFSKHMFDSVIIRAATGSLTRGVFIWRVLIESPEARNGSSKYHKHKLAASEEVIKKMNVKTVSSDEVEWILPEH